MRVPYGYRTQTVEIDHLRDILLEHYHPEYVRRLCAWLESKGGAIGVGGHFREDGTQPDLPGFAPEGKSFHQNQVYADGFIGACAVDVVKANPGGIHVAVSWDDVPAQGSDEAATWGVHANVGSAGVSGSEAWHIQPVEIDGWQRWINDGQPAPDPEFVLPGDESETVMFTRERLHDGTLRPGQILQVNVGHPNATGVIVNLTVVNPSVGGYLRIWPAATPEPETSDVNWSAGDAVTCNAVAVGVTDGHVSLVSPQATARVIVDLQAVFG